MSRSKVAAQGTLTRPERGSARWIRSFVAPLVFLSGCASAGGGANADEEHATHGTGGTGGEPGGVVEPLAGAGGTLDFYSATSNIDFAALDPSTDPGFDPIFVTDPELSRSEDYTYVFTVPGDHDLPPDTCVVEFDAGGPTSLLATLSPMQAELGTCTGLALYLTEGADRLRDADLRTLQILDRAATEGGLAASRLTRLYVYNLKSLQGGTECLPDSNLTWPNTGEVCAGTTALGSPGPWMWANGWAGGWVQDLVMDDLEVVESGTFCNTRFYSLSLRGARTIGKMAFGEQHHGHLKLVYLPSAVTIGEHAFRRIQVGLDSSTRVVLPRVTRIDSYAFDDNTDLEYVSAPQLVTMGRNVFNDTGRLISAYFPRLESMEHGCFGINTTMRVMNLPALKTIVGDGLSNLQEVRFLRLPSLEDMGGGALGGNARLQALFVPRLTRIDTEAMPGTALLTRLDLPASGLELANAALRNTSLEELWLTGETKTLTGMPFETCTSLALIHFGATPPVQAGPDAFAQTSPALIGTYVGDDPAWEGFTFAGNPTARLVVE